MLEGMLGRRSGGGGGGVRCVCMEERAGIRRARADISRLYIRCFFFFVSLLFSRPLLLLFVCFLLF